MTLIQVIRSMKELHLQYLLTAQELAIMAMRQSRGGFVCVAYSFLQKKIHAACRKTAMRHVQRLCDLGILVKKPVARLPEGYYPWNTYRFVVPFESNAPHTYYGDKRMSSSKRFGDKQGATFPNPEQEREKNLSLSEEIRRLRRGMQFLDPAGEHYADAQAQLTRLEGLQVRQGAHG